MLAYLKPYMPEPARNFVETVGEEIRIRYLDYDWSLNDLAKARG